MPKNSTKTHANDRGRFSAGRKTDAVLRLLRGEDLDTLSRELGVVATAMMSRAAPESRSASPATATAKRHGLQRVCRIFGLARSTTYSPKARDAVPPESRPVPRKRGPVGAAPDADLVGHIRRGLAESPFTGEGYRKVWARLRHQGVRTARPHARAATPTARKRPGALRQVRGQGRRGAE